MSPLWLIAFVALGIYGWEELRIGFTEKNWWQTFKGVICFFLGLALAVISIVGMYLKTKAGG